MLPPLTNPHARPRNAPPQFTTRECAEAASHQLAAALRLDAEAVTNQKISREELKRVSDNLAQLHANPRTMLNGTELPSLGRNGALGTCAFVNEGEFKPTGDRRGVTPLTLCFSLLFLPRVSSSLVGARPAARGGLRRVSSQPASAPGNPGKCPHSRFDATVSRFAAVVDTHDTLVYCPPGAPAPPPLLSPLSPPPAAPPLTRRRPPPTRPPPFVFSRTHPGAANVCHFSALKLPGNPGYIVEVDGHSYQLAEQAGRRAGASGGTVHWGGQLVLGGCGGSEALRYMASAAFVRGSGRCGSGVHGRSVRCAGGYTRCCPRTRSSGRGSPTGGPSTSPASASRSSWRAGQLPPRTHRPRIHTCGHLALRRVIGGAR